MSDDEGNRAQDTVGVFEQQLLARIGAGSLDLPLARTRSPPSPAPSEPTIGTILQERWEVTEELGRGSFGVVFEVRHLELENLKRAAKLLLSSHMSDPRTRDLFREEAATMARIKGSHLVDVTDYGELEGIGPFFLMERLYGESLQQFLEREGPLPLDRFVLVAQQLLRGLEELHAHQIVHRDLKPANIFVSSTPFHLKLLDFGLAKAVGSLTARGELAGTPQYMAPEQFGFPDETPSPRADLYSASAVLYQSLTGRLPIPSEGNLVEYAMRVASLRPRPVSSFRSDVPNAIVEAIELGLAKDPAKRPRNVAELWTRMQLGPWSGKAEPTKSSAGPKRSSSRGAKPVVQLVLGSPRRSAPLLRRAFRPKVRLKKKQRFSVGSQIAGLLETSEPVYVVVVHFDTPTGCVLRVHPPQEELTLPERVPARAPLLVIEGYATEPRGMKRFRAYWSSTATPLLALLQLPSDEPVEVDDEDVVRIFGEVDEVVATGSVGVTDGEYEVR